MAEETQYGGFWARFVAFLLDNAIVTFFMLAILLALGAAMAAAGMDSGMELVGGLITTLVPFLYWPVLESSARRATFGKRVMGLEVTDLEGNRIGFARALGRSLAKILSSIPFGIGFLIAAFTARKQGLHDIVAKTLVIRTGPSQLWKVVLAFVAGLALMAASAAGIFYYVVVPMFKKGLDDTMKQAMKGATPMKPAPAPGPASKAPPRAKPAAPAPQAAAAPAVPGAKAGPDPAFDAVIGKPLVGLEKPGTTRAGPAILELSTMFPSSLWIKVYLPLPPGADPAVHPEAMVTINRIVDAAGTNYYDPGNRFESEFFRKPSLKAEKAPLPLLEGTRMVNFNAGLREAALQRIDGLLTLTVPVDPKTASFGAKETGKERPVHDASVSLKSVSAKAATLHFRGATENLVLVRGFGADGKLLEVESRQILPARTDVDDDFTITFKDPPAKVEAIIASGVIVRFFPFSLTRGAVAGPPSTGDEGTTLPPRARTAKAASVAAPVVPAPSKVTVPAIAAATKPPAAKAEPKAAVAPAVPPPERMAAAEAKVKAPPPRAPIAAKPVEPRANAPAARPAPAPVRPAPRPARTITPRFNDVMTAVLYRDPAAVAELLDLGRWVDKRDSNGLTPLMAAASLRDLQTARLLIQRGADVNASAGEGRTPLAIARTVGDAAMADLLQASGAR